MKRHVPRRLAVAAATMGLVASGSLAASGSPVPVVAPAPPGLQATARPALKLEAARRTVTAESFEGEVFADLGVYAVAGNRPFEIRGHRSSYAKKIKAVQVKPGRDTKLPAGLVKDFTGLSGFFSLSIRDAAGRSVVSHAVDFCPGGSQSVRRRPGAPDTSPYPEGCADNPYSTGAVWGIQKGWGASALGYLDEQLKPGSYTATVTVAPAYRKALHIKAAHAHATVHLEVVKGDGAEMAAQRRLRAQSAARSLPAPTTLTGRAVKPQGLKPDLRSLPAWGISVEHGRYLDFSATVWNAGRSPLVVDGFRQAHNESLMNAYQYFYNSHGKQVGYAKVGTMEWDARTGHEHWHFTDFASYRLLNAKKKLVVRSQKEAFCLANTDAVDYTRRGANWKPDNTDLHTSCGDQSSVGVREVLDSGSGDTYQQYLPGQSFDLKGLKNGTYYIQVKANPDKRLHETSTKNNTSYRKVKVSGTVGHRTVVASKVGIVVEPPLSEEDPSEH